MMTAMSFFLWGIIGAAIDEVLHWAGIRRKDGRPTYASQLKYWVITAALVLVGGVVALALGISTELIKTPLAAMLAGFTAPALIKKLAKTFLNTAVAGPSDEQPPASVRQFLIR
jgi:hypothetical protein